MIWVVAQAILLGFTIFMPLDAQFKVSSTWHIVLTIIALSGLLVGFMAIYNLRHSLAVSPTPIQNGRLQTHGIYKYIRHPMYLAVWLVMFNVVVASGSWLKVAIWPVIVGFFIIKSHQEEKLLISKYDGYKDYMMKVGGFFPRL